MKEQKKMDGSTTFLACSIETIIGQTNDAVHCTLLCSGFRRIFGLCAWPISFKSTLKSARTFNESCAHKFLMCTPCCVRIRAPFHTLYLFSGRKNNSNGNLYNLVNFWSGNGHYRVP